MCKPRYSAFLLIEIIDKPFDPQKVAGQTTRLSHRERACRQVQALFTDDAPNIPDKRRLGAGAPINTSKRKQKWRFLLKGYRETLLPWTNDHESDGLHEFGLD